MEEPRRRLEVLDGGATAPSGSARRPEPDEQGGPNWLLVGLLALLLLALVGLGLETRRATLLEARVAGLEGELETARGALEAHRRHLDSVRASVAELQELVSRDPAPDAPR